MILFCDLETTGKNPYTCEIIEGYFELHKDGEMVDSYDFKSKVDEWSIEAEAIHNISYDEMILNSDKEDAFKNLVEWLPLKKDVSFCCYSNPKNVDGFFFYDYVALRMNLASYQSKFLNESLFNNDHKVDIYSLAKSCEKKGLFDAIVNPETRRKSFTQENVYKALFGDSYISHRAKSDVKALVKIYYELTDLSLNNISKTKQLRLL